MSQDVGPLALRILRDIIEGDDTAMTKAMQDGRDLLAAQRVNEVKKLPTAAFETIIATVAEYYGYTVLQLKSRERPAHLAHARQVAMVLCRTLVRHATLMAVGEVFHRDHGTVIHAERAVGDRLATDRTFDTTFAMLRGKLKAELRLEEQP